MLPRLYRAALRLLPPPLRTKHGRDMARLYAQQVSRARERGRLRGAWVGLVGIMDVVRRGLYERLRRSGRRGRETMMQDLMQDVRQAARSLLKAPRFTLVAVATLALGIGANSAIFSVVNGVMLRPLPFPNAERFVHLGWDWGSGEPSGYLTPYKFEYWREHTRSFDAMATWRGGLLRLDAGGEIQGLRSVRVSDDFLDVLGYTPLRGRGFTPAEHLPDGPAVVLLGHGTWQSRFGGDPGVVGSTLRLNEAPHTVVGVLPPDFSFPQYRDVEVVQPLGLVVDPRDEGANWPVVATLAEGVTREEAQADVARVTEAFRTEHPDLVGEGQRGMAVTSYEELYVGDLARTLWIVMGAVGFVLLIACANVANLLLARGAQRQREVAVRVALGASRGRIVRFVLTESVLLAVVAGAVGLGLSAVGVDALLALAPEELPRVQEVGVDGPVLAFTLLATLLTGILFGGVAAAPAARAGVAGALKEGVRGSSSGGRRVRQGLVLVQSALSMILLVGAGLLVSTVLSIRSVDPGYEARGLLTVSFPFRPPGYETAEQVWELERRIQEELRGEAAVTAVAGASNLPLERGWNIPVSIAGRPDDFEGAVEWRGVTPGYFETLEMEVTRGRGFTVTDEAGAPGVAVVNEAFARRYFPDSDPVGQQIEIGRFRGRYIHPAFEGPALEIVGVVEDVRDRSLRTEPARTVYVPQSQAQDMLSNMPVFLVRTPRPGPAGQAVVEAVRRVDARLPAPDLRTMDQVVDESLARERFSAWLMGSFAGMALLLTAFGVYGVISYTVRRRRREIGIRMALGAEGSEVTRMVTLQGMGPVLLGLALGVGGSVALARVAESVVWGVSPTDPATIGFVAVVLLAVALVASWLPAREATRVDPVRTLSAE